MHDKMATIELKEEHLHLIQAALDFYSRVGIGQFGVIKDHPTFERFLEKVCRPDKTPEVGDKTPQGEILEIKNGKALINGSVNKDGRWHSKKQWKKLEDVVLSTNYSRYHEIRDVVDAALVYPRNRLINDMEMPRQGSWGIYHPDVDDSCRVAFDILQVIRHEFWKRRGEKTFTVDSSVHHSSGNTGVVKVKLD